jgi:chromosome segregation ATPase
MPSISGTVSVPLAELDKMRSEHVTAVKLAQELESKQMLVRVDYRNVDDYSWENGGMDRYGYPIQKKVLKVEKTEYKNLDEFRDQIRSEEFDKLRDKFKKQESEIGSLKTKIIALEETKRKQADIIEQHRKAEEENLRLSELVSSSEKELTSVRAIAEGLRDSVKRLTEDNNILRHKKGFWGFLS